MALTFPQPIYQPSAGKLSRSRGSRPRMRWLWAAAMLAAGCAPDAFGPAPGYDGFLTLISQQCYPKTIAGQQIAALVEAPMPPFIDATSRLYYGKIDADAYRNLVVAFSDNTRATSDAIDCIVAHLPPAPAPPTR